MIPQLVLGVEWPDALQAIAAAIAIPGAIAGFIALFRRDKEKQAMIEELQAQTKHFGAQTDQLRQQVFQLSKIHEAIAKGIEVFVKNAEVSEMIRRNEMRPAFIFARSQIKGPMEGKLYSFLNRGGLAKNIKARWTVMNKGRLSVRTSQVDRNNDLNITIKWDGEAELPIAFELQYEDADGFAYRQQAWSENDFYIHLFDPELISQGYDRKRQSQDPQA